MVNIFICEYEQWWFLEKYNPIYANRIDAIAKMRQTDHYPCDANDSFNQNLLSHEFNLNALVLMLVMRGCKIRKVK